ncbi:hypothetical protein [Roseofilum capinflatum]|uniref:DUF304 domain-containing protein n=1 Tax=Roseofilum capinflatum BLCC-M114 TaxID=3022440 RepID=A0ABT7B699_9CYAN|nr:hypothetical protein [Roseofilum capinflatum]MDJ1174684.1 hypothetical protein [Roseofilum capinflatum BLCC-M114]
MVILENTATELKFRHRPQKLWMMTLGLIFGLPVLIALASLFASWILYIWPLPLFYLTTMITGVGVLLTNGKTKIYTFSKTRDRLTIISQGVLGTDIQEYSLADIWDIQLEPLGWSGQASQRYQIMLILNNGQSLPLNLGIPPNSQAQMQTLNHIHQFLGLNLGTWRKPLPNLKY